MKKSIYFIKLLLFLILNSNHINAQCNITPTITSPRLGSQFDDFILLCNYSDTETISATEDYDSYQWYKLAWSTENPNPNSWEIIPGAISRNLNVTYSDVLFYFKLEVSRNNCTVESNVVFVDEFAFASPYLLITFEPDTFEYSVDDAEYQICQGSSVILEQGWPVLYENHIWFKCIPLDYQNMPLIPPHPNDPCVIPNINGDNYIATETGTYGFYSCTEYCPSDCAVLGTLQFVKLNFGNWSHCSLEHDNPNNKIDLRIYPNPTINHLFIGDRSDNFNGKLTIFDSLGKKVIHKNDFKSNSPVDVSSLNNGVYTIILEAEINKIFKSKFIKK